MSVCDCVPVRVLLCVCMCLCAHAEAPLGVVLRGRGLPVHGDLPEARF